MTKRRLPEKPGYYLYRDPDGYTSVALVYDHCGELKIDVNVWPNDPKFDWLGPMSLDPLPWPVHPTEPEDKIEIESWRLMKCQEEIFKKTGLAVSLSDVEGMIRHVQETPHFKEVQQEFDECINRMFRLHPTEP